MNIHGAHSYWKQGALGAAGVRRVWAGAGPQRAAYRGGGTSCGLAHRLLKVFSRRQTFTFQLSLSASLSLYLSLSLSPPS